MMKITRLTCFFAAAIALAAVSGCSSNRRVPAEPCRSYSMVAGAIGVNNATLANAGVRMGSVVGGKKTDPRQNSNIGNVGLRGALEQSLARFGMLSPTGTYELNATLVEEDVRLGRDGTVSVTETAFYQLRDDRSGRDVFQGVFSGGATVSAMDALPGAMLRVAKERAMKMNIENFLLALDRAFPQEKNPAQP